MSAFKLSIGDIRQEIYSARLSEAMVALLQLQPELKSEIRERNHVQGIILIRQGQFDAAIEIFLKTLQSHGHHVSLIIDLATCYYLTGQIQNWLRIMELAEYELRQVEDLISWERKADLMLILGKFREEQGALSEALIIHETNLQTSLSHVTEKRGSLDLVRIQTQILRLQSQYGISAKTQDLYKQLIHHSSRDTDWDCTFEVEHALMIFESRHFGLEHGFLRLKKLMSNPLMTTYEITLLYSDCAYEALFHQHSVPTEIIDGLQKIENLSPYDACILQLAQGMIPTDLAMLDWPEAMSPAAHLRLMLLVIQRAERKSEIRKKYVLLLSDLSAKSKKLWLSWADHQSQEEAQQVFYHKKDQCLEIEGRKLDLSAKPAFRELVELLIDRPRIHIYDATAFLWQGSATEQDVSRLRMRVRRCNTEIEKAWGISSFFVISESQLGCSYLTLPSGSQKVQRAD